MEALSLLRGQDGYEHQLDVVALEIRHRVLRWPRRLKRIVSDVVERPAQSCPPRVGIRLPARPDVDAGR